jgi:cobalt-zinc-cadmium efflux system outer membrane protein
MPRPLRLWALLISSAVVASPALASPLTLNEALARARETAPSLRAKSLSADASRSAREAAGALPDPKLSLGIDSFPISGPLAFAPARDNFTMARVGVSQDFPNLAKRHAQQARADTDITAADADIIAQTRTVEIETAIAWITLAYAEKRLVALDAVHAKLDRLVGTTPKAVASGAARPAQTIGGRQALAALDDRRDELVLAVARGRADLIRWTSDPAPEIAGSMPEFEIAEAQFRAALDTNPMLAPIVAKVGQAEANTRVAEAERRPDFGVNLAYQRRDPRFGDYVSAGVTIGLPLFKNHRQEPLIAARVADANGVRAELEAERRRLLADLGAGVADHAMHHAQWLRARDTLAPLARERVDLETASYAAGRASLIDIVEAHSALVDATLTTLDREALVALDGARLSLTYRSEAR